MLFRSQLFRVPVRVHHPAIGLLVLHHRPVEEPVAWEFALDFSPNRHGFARFSPLLPRKKSLISVKECISPSSSHSDQKFGGILVSGKCDYESGLGISFHEAYGRSISENDNESGVGYDPPDGSRDMDLGL